MRTIYKYVLEPVDRQTIEVPAHAEFLAAQMQHGQICVWAIVNTENEPENELFVIVGTGNPIPDKPKFLQFIGTVQQAGGAFIWHVFKAVK